MAFALTRDLDNHIRGVHGPAAAAPLYASPPPPLAPATARALSVFVAAAGTIAAVWGTTILVGGWVFGMTALTAMLPGFATMKANTAVAIAALGTALALRRRGRSARLVGRAATGVALVVGLVTLAEYAFHWSPNFDQLLIRDLLTSPSAFPGRPAVATALALVFLGGGLGCADTRVLGRGKAVGATAAMVIGWAALNGSLFGADALREIWLFNTVSIPTAATLLIIGTGLLAAEPVSWPVRMLVAPGTAGTVARWLIPLAVLAPSALGWLLGSGSATGAGAFRWALYAVSSSCGAVAVIFLLVQRISIAEAERSAATELSLRDPLTGLANRRAFESFLQENVSLATRHGHALSLVLLDLDHFKRYNDAFGHPAGDEALKTLGVLIPTLLRGTDLLARIGGEEFAIVLPQTDLSGARIPAERVRAEIAGSPKFAHPISVSVGIAALSESITSASTLLRACDQALYAAKRGGRNRVAAASD